MVSLRFQWVTSAYRIRPDAALGSREFLKLSIVLVLETTRLQYRAGLTSYGIDKRNFTIDVASKMWTGTDAVSSRRDRMKVARYEVPGSATLCPEYETIIPLTN